MPPRQIKTDDGTWEVAPTGRVTQYTRDELGVTFRNLGNNETRVTRYAPMGSRFSEDSLAELSEQELRNLLSRSQPGWTAPELEYRR